MIKKYLIILIVSFIFFILLGTLFLFSKNELILSIKSNIPTSIKENLKTNIFFIPSKLREFKNLTSKVQQLDLKTRKLNRKIDVLNSKINAGKIETLNLDSINGEKFILKKIFLDYSLNNLSKKMEKKNGYLEIYQDKVLSIFWTGKILYTKKDNLKNQNVNFFELETNVNNFLKFDEKDKFISIKDAMISDNKLYLSYTKNLKPETNCLNLSIISADIYNGNEKLELSKFSEFFTYDECLEARFNGYQSGGRIVNFKNDHILLTIGDFQNFTPAQNINSLFGKIISINKKTKDYRLISMGHRNQQGLFYDDILDLIISTEHGQKGGDEVNLIIDNKNMVSNYGWPIASYSNYYGYETNKIKKIAPFKKSHKDNGFIEPLIYFTPALGISQVIKNSSFDFNNNYSYLVTSMAKKKILIINLDKNLNSATVDDEIYLGERIRDIIKFENENYLLFLEDSPAIGILNKIKN